jgi:hypothetical protein
MAVYNNSLYLGTKEGNKGELYRYDGATTWTSITTTPGTFDTSTSIDGISSMATYNGALYFGTQENNNSDIFRYDNGSGVKNTSSSSLSSRDKVDALLVYNGRIYAGITDSNNAETWRYNCCSDSNSWSRVSIGSGRYITGGNRDIDSAGSMAALGGSLFQMTGDTRSGFGSEVFKYTDYEGQSYALKFQASSDNAGVNESVGLPNTASIFFSAEQQAVNNGGDSVDGTFIFTHGISTSAGAYDVAEDYPTRDYTFGAGYIETVDEA